MAAPARGAAGGANQVSDESSSTSAHAPQVRASQTDATRLNEKSRACPACRRRSSGRGWPMRPAVLSVA